MDMSTFVRLCLVGSDKGGMEALAQEDTLLGSVLRDLESLPAREGNSPPKETARKLLLASGIEVLRTLELAIPQPENEPPVPVLQEEIPESLNPDDFLGNHGVTILFYSYEFPNWLCRHGKSMPCFLLPGFLKKMADGGGTLEVFSTLGRRGVQICRDNPAWQSLAADCDALAAAHAIEENRQLWEKASPKVQLFLLRQLRARDPKRGRELAEPLLRQQFQLHMPLVCGLWVGLSNEDIPLLEELHRIELDSSQKRINLATVLLSLLPESALFRELAEEELFAWKDGRIIPGSEAAWEELSRDLGNGSLLMSYSLDWWLARTGKDSRELWSAFMHEDDLDVFAAVAARTFLENRPDWLRAALEAFLAQKKFNFPHRKWAKILGLLAARMLHREELEQWLIRLFQEEHIDSWALDQLVTHMLLHVRFVCSRNVWLACIECVSRRAKELEKFMLAKKVESSQRRQIEQFSLLWDSIWSFDDFCQLRQWTDCGQWSLNTTLMHRIAWDMPLDLLEELIRVLAQPDNVWFEYVRQGLGAILKFREQAEQA